MKKFLFYALATAVMGLSFTSCDKEEDDSNAKVSLDGRWDGTRKGGGHGFQDMTLIFNGNEVDVYIIAWGDHLKGTYTYQNDSLYFSFKNENAYDALIVDEHYKGWNVSDGAFDPETLELTYTEEYPYRWYVMDPEDFEMDVEFLSSFEFKLIDEKTAVGGQMELEFTKR
jgi:hypothetical protein